MIIDTSQGNIEVYGDIKEFKTSIDPKNLEFITTLLSSNLYSDPEQSFIREIVSNAWDSHVEAGTTDTPVIIRFKEDSYSEKSITIRDYGTGLSPERFKEVYCNIGSSTKRESNEFIGGFGIGKYSSLACSNTVYITSYYEGTAYYYVMVKSGNSITTNLLMEKPTAEKNGVEVTIKNLYDLSSYRKALQYIIFFPNVYIDGISNEINDAKLKRFKHFAASSVVVDSKLLLGNVLYPCNKTLLSYDAQQFLNAINNTGIVVKFDVGEINITPNRESIIYSSDTIKKIETRIKDAKKELEALINVQVAKDYDDLLEYCKVVLEDMWYDPISGESKPYRGYKVRPLELKSASITYKGVDIRKEEDMLKWILNLQLPNFKGIVDDDKICLKNIPWSCKEGSNIRTKNLLILNEKARLVSAVRLWLREKWDKYSIITYLSKDEYKKYVKESISIQHSLNKNFDFIVEGAYDAMIAKSTMVDLETDESYLAFKDNLAANKVPGSSNIGEAILYVWDDRGWKEKKSFKRFSHAVDFIKKLKKGVILCNMDANDELFSNIAKLKNYTYIKARKDIVSSLREMNLSCLVDLEWVLFKDPMLSVVAAILKHFPDGIPSSEVLEVNATISKDEAAEFKRIHDIYQKLGTNYWYRGAVMDSKAKCDEYTEYLCLKLRNYLEKHKEAKKLVTLAGSSSSTLTTAVIMMTKAYKVSGEAYNKIKNNPLLKVLCRK